jgi:hypothetical protein
MAKTDLTAARLRELLDYDPDTGILRWKRSFAGPARAGDVAGTKTSKYVFLKIEQQRYSAHRLAWLWWHGSWPQDEVDHINGNTRDNRLSNLRDVPRGVNQQNVTSANVDSLTGILGVTYRKDCPRRPWVAQISHENRTRRLGGFKTQDEAHAAYLAAKRRLHEGCTI